MAWRESVAHSLLKTRAGCPRAAVRPGSAATTFARTSAAGTAIKRMARSGPTGSGTTPQWAGEQPPPPPPHAVADGQTDQRAHGRQGGGLPGQRAPNLSPDEPHRLQDR